MSVSGFHGDNGSFTKTMYDRCAYQKRLHESTSPLQWQMYAGKHENCSKCTYDEASFYTRQDKRIVDVESELKNITRRNTRCPQYKYLPGCKKSCYCTGTFDPSVPVNLPQEVCPIIHNNLPRVYGPGYNLPEGPMCQKQARVQRNPLPRRQ
jgi:hypothetical protein